MGGLFRSTTLVLVALVVGSLPSSVGDLRAQPAPAGSAALKVYQQWPDSLLRVTLEYFGPTELAQPRDPCIPGDLQTDWIDWLNRKVSKTVCGSAMWFDGFFGDATVYDEKDTSHGRIFTGLWWDERGGIDPKFKFRVKAALPRLKNRSNIVLGRESVDNFVSAGTDGAEGLPQSLATSDEEEWFLGLGYTPLSGRYSRLRLDVGARVKVPLDPYARLHYRQNFFLGQSRMARFRETLFWERSRGFGASTRLDFDWTFSDRMLIRTFGLGTFAESIRGLEWQAGAILYSYVGPSQAIAVQADIRGETGRGVPIIDYGLTGVYRRTAFRSWLFAELSAGVSWPRELLEEEREINPGAGIGFEMFYGASRHR